MYEIPAVATPEVKSPTSSKTIYLPGLNGLRAIAAIAVVMSHTTLELGSFGLDNRVLFTNAEGKAQGIPLAGYGVTLFFTLSGFLITYLLLKEKETAPLNIKNFYIRRILRIWPLYYLYLLVAVGVMGYYHMETHQGVLPFYIFLAANIPFIMAKTLPFITHYWSLGVEEQFYLFFPQLARVSNRNLLRGAVFLVAILMGLKFVFWILARRYGNELPLLALGVTRFHTMLIGAIGAILYYNNNSRFLAISTHLATQIIAWGCMLLITLNKFHIASVIDGELVSVLSVFLIMGQITKRNLLLNLENKVCDFIGRISFGVYVIHPMLIFFAAKFIGTFTTPHWYHYLLVYAVILTATITLSWLSYEYYEKWFLKLKSKYTTVKSRNSRSSH